MGSHKSGVEGKNHPPQPAGHAPFMLRRSNFSPSFKLPKKPWTRNHTAGFANIHSWLFFQQPPIKLDQYRHTQVSIITVVTVTMLAIRLRAIYTLLMYASGARLYRSSFVQCISMRCTKHINLVSVILFFKGNADHINKEKWQQLHGLFQPSSFCWLAHHASQRFLKHPSWKLRSDSLPAT